MSETDQNRSPVAEFSLKVNKTLRYHANRALCAGRHAWWQVMKPGLARPVFVVGCSRAGTTLVYKTLSESRHLGSLQRETHEFWASLHPIQARGWRSHVLGEADASEADRLQVNRYFYSHLGRQRIVDKNNQNGLNIPYLHALFPDAYFVYVKRSPGDNINSLIEGWRRPDEYGEWSDDIPVPVNVENGRFKRWCFFLPEGWRAYTEASIEEVCAFQYVAMNQTIIEARRGVAPGHWVELSYEDLLSDPVGHFESVFNGLDVPFDGELRQHCETVLKRPYNAFSEIRRDKWKDGKHAEKIERVLDSTEMVARRMGYDISRGS